MIQRSIFKDQIQPLNHKFLHRRNQVKQIYLKSHWKSRQKSSHKKTTQLCRSERGHVPKRRFSIEGENIPPTLALFAGDPVSAEEAMEVEEWRVAMREELLAIQRNQTWQLVKLLKGKNFISLKWIFKTKYLADGSVQKYKARLVVRGNTTRRN